MSERDQVIIEALRHGRVQASGWTRINCPGFCEQAGRGPDTRESFGFNTRTGGYSCNRCKAHGKVGGVVAVGDARQPTQASNPRRAEFMPLWTRETRDSLSLGPAYEYMRHRGFSVDVLRQARVHAAAVGKYAGRVIVPHIDEHQKWWGFTARCWVNPVDETPKVLYPPGMPRRLYNGQALLEETDDPCLVMEGGLDALRYLPDVAACLGKPTEEHLTELVLARRPVVFALDGDAWEEGVAWCQRLRFRGREAASVRLPAGQDPADVEPHTLILQAREALRAVYG